MGETLRIHLENQVAELKCELEELKKTNIEMSKTLSEVVQKIKVIKNKTKEDNEKVAIKSKPNTKADNERGKKTGTIKIYHLKKNHK